MRLIVAGIDYRTAPVEVREQVAISSECLPDALAALRQYVPQAVVLSTCNRTEVYATDEDGIRSEADLTAFLESRLAEHGCSQLPAVSVLTDDAAFRHLFRITSGLESMIVGEYEILGQVSHALEVAEKVGMVNLSLRRLFQSAIRTGRRVREETGISRNALSVSSVAVNSAAAVFGDLSRCRMLVIGTGEAGQLVAKVAREKGTSHIVIASRTRDRAQALATGLGATATDTSNIHEELRHADIVVTCTGAPHQILDVDLVTRVMAERTATPMVIIDIGVPRNVDPNVRSVANVHLQDIDDLNRTADAHRRQREQEIQQAEHIVAEEVERFAAWWREVDVRPLVTALMNRAESVRSAQLGKTVRKLPPLSPEQMESLESMTKSIVTRLLQDPIDYLKSNGNGHHSDVLKRAFHLDTEEPS